MVKRISMPCSASSETGLGGAFPGNRENPPGLKGGEEGRFWFIADHDWTCRVTDDRGWREAICEDHGLYYPQFVGAVCPICLRFDRILKKGIDVYMKRVLGQFAFMGVDFAKGRDRSACRVFLSESGGVCLEPTDDLYVRGRHVS